MSAPRADTDLTETLAKLDHFLRAKPASLGCMSKEECAKVKDLCADIRHLDGSSWSLVARGFGRVFARFERAFSVFAPRGHRRRNLPALNDAARVRARPRVFTGDYATFDRLSVVYGGLFRGSVIVNYLLGVAAVALTVSSILPQPRFIAGSPLFPEFAYYAVAIELVCLVIIGFIFCYGQTPRHETMHAKPSSHRRGLKRLVAHRWHERWLEYRVLAERFRYLELVLSLSTDAMQQRPFARADLDMARWYDCYFVWRTEGVKREDLSVHEYRERAIALMVEQVEHHDANNLRRGAIARSLHRGAVLLFFSSLVLCAVHLIFEASTLRCESFSEASTFRCGVTVLFNESLKSLVLFGAVMAPVLAAAIHGVLTTTEYTKIAESSKQIADRIAPLVATVKAFPASEERAVPEALKPIRDAVTAFADAAINEASNWRAMLRDKNIPLA